MAKAIVMGCACVVVSELTPEDVERRKRFDPDALVLKNEIGETVCELDLSDGPGCMEADRIELSTTKSADGRATITILLDPDAEDKTDMVRKHLGPVLLSLDALEKKLTESADGVKEMEARVGAMITAV